MKVILVESVIGLGRAGEVVNVKAGYGRNYLIPNQIAMFLSEENLAIVEAKRAEMEKADAAKRVEAQKLADQLSAMKFVMKVETNDEGQMFGTSGPSEIVKLVADAGVEIERKMVNLPEAISELGEHDFSIQCHIDVKADLKLEVVS